jgi:hypothetical protein
MRERGKILSFPTTFVGYALAGEKKGAGNFSFPAPFFSFPNNNVSFEAL